VILTIIINKPYGGAMTVRNNLVFAVGLTALLGITACTTESVPDATDTADQNLEPQTVVLDSPSIVATTSILGDVATQISTCVADREEAVSDHVRTLLPIGTDPHDFEPSSEQVASMIQADIVVANGLMLEEGLIGVFDQIESEGGNLFETAEWVDPLEFSGAADDDHDHDHGHEDEAEGTEESHEHGDFDPHYWLDMSRMALVAEELGNRLATDTGDAAWSECGVEVANSITAAEDEVIAILETIPGQKRVMITDHDAFAYFADRYGFEIAGVVIPGGSTLADATSQDIAQLVEEVTSREVLALIGSVFRENTLLDTIAAESGGLVSVVPLYVESVGEPGSDTGTYQQMMIWNAQQIAGALQD
jgi:zinc/manganese transport system substrate-binding protein